MERSLCFPRKGRDEKELFYHFDPESLIPEGFILREIIGVIDFRPIHKNWQKSTLLALPDWRGVSGSDVADSSDGLLA